MLSYALLGMLAGVLLNIASDCLPSEKEGSLPGPPRCPHCGAVYHPSAWIGALALLSGRHGRCPHCQALISWRRPALELATVLLFIHVWQRFGASFRSAITSFHICILLLATVTDLEHRLVLNKLVLPAVVAALLANLIHPVPGLGRALLGGLINFGILYLAAIGYKGGMGAGDVKLAGFIGLATGYPQAILALAISIIVGGLVALFLLITHIKDRKSYIPYAPFLAIGGIAMLLYGQEIEAILSKLWTL